MRVVNSMNFLCLLLFPGAILYQTLFLAGIFTDSESFRNVDKQVDKISLALHKGIYLAILYFILSFHQKW